jgi:hypothetical protein
MVRAGHLRHLARTVAAMSPKNKSRAARFHGSARQDSPVPMSLPIIPSYSVSSEKARRVLGILHADTLKTDSPGILPESL